jgi:PAS domain S-box-containing protein
MVESLLPLAYLRDARLAGHATAVLPVWLWRADGRGILWANATGAVLWGTASPAQLSARSFSDSDETARQIAGLGESLPANGSPRLERVDGFSKEPGRTLLCLCSRLTVDEEPAVLVVATETGGVRLPLDERVRRLFGDIDAAMAAFTTEGTLIHATSAAAEIMGGLTTLATLGAGVLGSEALAKGHAEGRTPLGVLRLDRIGRDDTLVLVTTFPRPPAQVRAAGPVVQAQPSPGPSDAPAPPAAEAAAPSQVESSLPPTVRAAAETPESPETPPAAAEPPPADSPAPDARAHADRTPDRRHPLRFVWQMDPEGRFTVDSDDFAELIGPESATVLGQPWIDIAAKRKLDPDAQVERAVESQQTWSGITVHWPVDGTEERLAVELSGLPMFDRDRTFRGYRGFGVCRDAERFAHLPRPKPEPDAAIAPASAIEPEPLAEPVQTAEAAQPPEPAQQPPNVVPFRGPPAGEGKAPALSPVERSAFRELARQLSARLKGDEGVPDSVPEPHAPAEPEQTASAPAIATPPSPPVHAWTAAPDRSALQTAAELAPDEAELPPNGGAREILDRLPVGVLVYRISTPLYANRSFLVWSGHANIDAFVTAGGLDGLFLESGLVVDSDDSTRLTLATDAAHGLAASRLFTINWEGETAHALVVVPAHPARHDLESALRRAEIRTRELTSLVDLMADGVVMIDAAGNILSVNPSAETLFGTAANDLIGRPFVHLLAPENRAAAAADIDAMMQDGLTRREAREVTGCMREAGAATLIMTLGAMQSEQPIICAVFRDITHWKRSEAELIGAKRQAEQASRAKSDFLAKVSHEIRTPLNAIIGFSEVIMQERLGPIGNERYRAYLKDIHSSGEHLIALLNDLLDLSKIEAGKLELTFGSIDLNAQTQQCVALMQPQANTGRVIIRTSLAPSLPPIVADSRSVRQILLNLLSNSIRFTGPGGQVIVSTGLTDKGEVVLRVRDTGVGMSERDIETALEPFRQIETTTHGAGGGAAGTGLGLPLTKALAEANRASFAIKSVVNSGTLVEIAFAAARAPGR